MENKNLFNDIKPYDYSELNGKTLQISVVDDEELFVMFGKDIESDKVYILNYEVKKNEV